MWQSYISHFFLNLENCSLYHSHRHYLQTSSSIKKPAIIFFPTDVNKTLVLKSHPIPGLYSFNGVTVAFPLSHPQIIYRVLSVNEQMLSTYGQALCWVEGIQIWAFVFSCNCFYYTPFTFLFHCQIFVQASDIFAISS